MPILTIPGENFAQRVASGMMKSAELDNVMIARDIADYEALAVKMAQRPALRRALSAR